MANPDKLKFYESMKNAAIEQQIKYGIPASVTLAQMYIESGGGRSKLAVNGNNYFGIKCTKEWLAAGKPYSLHNDDRPNEKFCNYNSVEESVQHHSQFLMGKRYKDCRACDSTDYEGWARGLQAAGYATDKRYANTLIGEIETYDLQKYDQQALLLAQQKGVAIGYMRSQAGSDVTPSSQSTLSVPEESQQAVTMAYCFPVAGDNLVMSDGFGIKPTSYRNHAHNGIDLRAQYQDVFATENQGKVVSIGYQPERGGKFVAVEYERADGSKWRVSYCHLDKINVSEGDIVNAGTKLGVSGNTGNSTGPHLHLTVKHLNPGQPAGEAKAVDPLSYLAEIAVRGNLQGTVLKKGTNADLLADLKGSVDTTPTPADTWLAEQQKPNLTDEQRHNAEEGALLADATGSNDPKNMLAYLLGMNGDQASQGGDLFSSLISALFMAAIGMAMTLNDGDDNSQTVDDTRRIVPSDTEDHSLVKRHREGIDGNHARELASMNFEAESPEENQTVQRQRV